MTLITEEEMLRRLHNVLGDEYEVLSNTMADGDTYSKARAQVKHLACGIVSDKNVVVTIANARKCAYCSEKANITKRFFDRLKSTYPGDEYILEGEYKGYSVPTVFRHKCGATFRAKPMNLISGMRKHLDCSFTVDHTEPITIGAEEWKPIPDSNYSVSNYGRVRNDKSSQIMKLPKNAQGYPQVYLYYSPEKKKGIQRAAHKLVAEAFIPNPEGLPVVNHMDESQDNNRADNLQWATYQYNATYGTLPERSHKPTKGKPVYAIFPDGTDMYFDKIGTAADYFGGSVTPPHIAAVLAGRQRTTGGLVFERA